RTAPLAAVAAVFVSYVVWPWATIAAAADFAARSRLDATEILPAPSLSAAASFSRHGSVATIGAPSARVTSDERYSPRSIARSATRSGSPPWLAIAWRSDATYGSVADAERSERRTTMSTRSAS